MGEPSPAAAFDAGGDVAEEPAEGGRDSGFADGSDGATEDVSYSDAAEDVSYHDASGEEAAVHAAADAGKPSPAFAVWFDNASHPAPKSVLTMADGGFLVIAGAGRAALVRLDDLGDLVWEKKYSGTLGEEFHAGTRDGSTLFVAGMSRSWGGTSLGSAWLLSLSTDGGINTQKALQVTSASARGELLAVASSGGSVYAVGALGNRALFVKTDTSLNLAWHHAMIGSPNIYDRAEARALVPTSSGFVAVGNTHVDGNLDESIWGIAMNAAGEVQWQYRYATGNSDTAHAVDSTSDGGFVIGGVHASAAWVGKLNPSGELQWARAFGSKDSSRISAIKQTSKGTYLAAGETWSTGKGSDAWVLELDSTGEILWQKAYGGAFNDAATAVVEANGRYVVAGVTSSYGGNTPNGFVMAVDEAGNLPDACPAGFATPTSATAVSLVEPAQATTVGEDSQQASFVGSQVAGSDLAIDQGRLCGD